MSLWTSSVLSLLLFQTVQHPAPEVINETPRRLVLVQIGHFTPGSRQARALILLHELGHLIQDGNGAWLIPDDGHNERQSKANTLRVQQVCHAQLETLK